MVAVDRGGRKNERENKRRRLVAYTAVGVVLTVSSRSTVQVVRSLTVPADRRSHDVKSRQWQRAARFRQDIKIHKEKRYRLTLVTRCLCFMVFSDFFFPRLN